MFLLFLLLFQPGKQSVYNISIHEKVLANYRSLSAGKTDSSGRFSESFENNYQFALSLTILSEENNNKLVRGSIDVQSIVLKQGNQEDKQRAAAFNQSAAQPFYFKVNAAGNISAIQTAANSPASYINFLRDVLSQLQFVNPGNQDDTAWTINQEYPDGIYKVRYVPVNENSFNKTISAKVRNGNEVEKRSSDSLTEFKNWVTLSKNSIVADKIFYQKKFYQKLGAITIAYVERTLQSEPAGEQRINPEAFIAAYRQQTVSQSINIYNPVTEEQRKVMVSRGVLKKDTYETLMAQLPGAGNLENESLNVLISKFRALLFLQPQYIPHVLETISGAEGSSFTVLVSALIEVDTEPAQDALAKFIDKNAGNGPVLQRLLPAIGLRRYLSASLEKSLLALRLHSEYASIAGLTLSNLCRQIGPERADNIMGHLVQDYWQGPKDKASIIRFLNETGNSGYSKALEENKKYLLHEDVDMRLRAWGSLRLFNNAAVDTLLARGLLNDTTAAVQNRILTMIHSRPILAVYKEAVEKIFNNTVNKENKELARLWLEKLKLQ